MQRIRSLLYSPFAPAWVIVCGLLAALGVISFANHDATGRHSKVAFSLGAPAQLVRHTLAGVGAPPPTHFAVYARRHHCGAARSTDHQLRTTWWRQRYQHCRLQEPPVRRVRMATPQPPTPLPPAPRPTTTATLLPPVIQQPTVAPLQVDQSLCGGGSLPACAAYLVDRMNAERAQYGVGPLALNNTLSNGTATCIGALGHAQHMVTLGYLAHDQFPADVCLPYSIVEENIGVAAYGSVLADVQQIHAGMAAEPYSPGCGVYPSPPSHHCNWMNPGVHLVGIGIAPGPYQGYSAYYLSEEFTN